jgi:hypothetical protein
MSIEAQALIALGVISLLEVGVAIGLLCWIFNKLGKKK